MKINKVEINTLCRECGHESTSVVNLINGEASCNYCPVCDYPYDHEWMLNEAMWARQDIINDAIAFDV